VGGGRTLHPCWQGEAQGREAAFDRQACLAGILFVLRSGTPWEMLPQELRCGFGMTCWRRFRDWQDAGIWQLIHFVLLNWLARCGRIDWSRAVVDAKFSSGSFWGQKTGPNPTDRAKLDSKRHLVCDGQGVPLAIQLTGANRNDSQEALRLVDAIPRLQGRRGRPRHRPDCVLGDRGYDAQAIPQGLRHRHMLPLIAKRNTEHGSGLVDGAGLSSEALLGSTSIAGCASDTRNAPTSMRHFWFWRAS
jgi:transposase